MRPSLVLLLLTACGREAVVTMLPAVPVDVAEPWVEPAPGGRYLKLGGAPFLVMGNQPGSGFLDLPDDEIDAHFARMQANGETVARLDFDYAYEEVPGLRPARYVGLESQLGVFDPARVARIDRTFELARAHDVRILVVPWVTSPPMWGTWALNPYHAVAADPTDFMTSARAREAFGARLERIAERWGGTTTFFGWDLMNESGILLGDDPGPDAAADLARWVNEIAPRVAAKERALYGREHVRNVSWWDTSVPEGFEFLLDSPALNSASTHPYDHYGTFVGAWPDIETRFAQPALTTHTKLNAIVGRQITDRRPYFENEHHQNDQTMLSFYREADHHLAWAELTSGASGTGLTWLIVPESSFPGPEHRGFAERHQALGPSRRALADFVAHRVPARFFTSSTTDEGVTALTVGDPAVTVMSVRRGDVAIAWLVGNDDTCLRVRSVEEIRGLRRAHQPYNVYEGGLAGVIWWQLLTADGATLDLSVAEGLRTAVAERDYAAAVVAEERVLDYLEGVEASANVLGRHASCASLAPQVRLAMPAGLCTVDWVDDRTGQLVRSDARIACDASVTAPPFFNHLAAVVQQVP